jgi:peroxiredoxin family protein/rhodanese-related sulfurtransferase/TusA-related sulfurtransferase
MDGLDKLITYKKALELKDEGVILVDVRQKDEWDLGHVEGSVLIPHTELRERLEELPKDKPIILMCQVGLRGHIAGRILSQHGFTEVYNVTGGYKTLGSALADDELLKNYNYCDTAECKEEQMITQQDNKIDLCIDATGLQCPGPIVKLKKSMDKIEEGKIVKIQASDPGFLADVKSWCKMLQNELIDSGKKDGVIYAIIKKGGAKIAAGGVTAAAPVKNGASIVVFSNDFDKAIAALVLANGAAATGKDVTMFFTFWGLTVLRTKANKKIKKDAMGKMFSSMLPSDMEHLKLSGMNFAGLGPKMMKSRMKKKNIDQLREMFNQAKAQGVKMIACQMSMDIMGIAAEELLPGAEIGGVATYMAAASECDVNLFI